MKSKVTIILILHNRHTNLDRLLEFYESYEISIIIADSSSEEHLFVKPVKNGTYIYTPGITYTQKIETILEKVTTPFVVLCADDDFIIPAGLNACVDFLSTNSEYSAAQGLILKYYKNTISARLRVDMLYQGDHSVISNDPFERLKKLFNPYKSLLYAVHRTTILKAAFLNAGKTFNNLYLNEYLVSIVPVLFGRVADLPVFYQVREYCKESDDKITDNLDVIFKSKKYEKEVNQFISHIDNVYREYVDVGAVNINEQLRKVLMDYAFKIESFKNRSVPFKKRIALLASHTIPFGKKLISARRLRESNLSIKRYLAYEDMKILKNLDELLKKYNHLN